MEITVCGRPKKITKKLVKRAAEHFAEVLLSSRLSANIATQIIFLPESSTILRPNDCGHCVPSYENSTQHPRDFEFYLWGNMSRKTTLLTLAHEMVHLKQYARGELFEYHYKQGTSRWQGKIFEDDERVGDNYWFMPWEIEAMGYEQGLVRTFVKKMQEEGIKLSARFDLN